TAWLLPHLPAKQTEYIFTDLSPTFVAKAQARFTDYDFVAYRPLDIEQAPVEQGFSFHQTDMVIAANVLHATKDLRQTLTHIRQLLTPGGQLVLLEATAPRRWIDLTFGLTDGWWRFQDQRRDYPLITAAEWQTLLLDCGFGEVSFVEETHLGQAVIVAQADQIVTGQGQAYLLFTDETGVGEALAAQLRRRGEHPILIYAGDAYQQVDEHIFRIRPNELGDYHHLLTMLPKIYGVVHLWSVPVSGSDDAITLDKAVRQSCGSVLPLIQALLGRGGDPPRLWLVTRDAQAVLDGDRVTGFGQSALWGMGQVITLEHPELNCVRIDLDREAGAEEQAVALCAELMMTDLFKPLEDQIALRRNTRYVARLGRYQPQVRLPMPDEPFQLHLPARGTLETLQFRPLARRAPAPNEVEIQVRAIGLNFQDVANVLGLVEPGPMGVECVGEITAVGRDVDAFAIGDRVMGIVPDSFSQYLTLPAQWLIPKPAGMDDWEAATIPVAFVTADYCLHQLARIKPGDRVLIHAATGGVGQAAVQLAQQAGAELFGTASPGKWAALKSLGVQHIYNSRTLDFAAQIMDDTDGQGVDIVLNSLTGDGFIERNLSVLSPNGLFLEMGKHQIWSAAQIAAARPDVTYFQVDLLKTLKHQPESLHAILSKLMAQFEQGQLKPLPHTRFAIDDIISAFRTMQQAKHIGKIVVAQTITRAVVIEQQATYLVTGGLGGLGLLAARWLAEQGAGRLRLVGRSQPNRNAQAQLQALAAMGADVSYIAADVTDAAQLEDILAGIDPTYPLRGIIHAAGVLDDGVLLHQSWDRFAAVLAPKIEGAWNLHRLTQDTPLDFCIFFASSVGLLGNRGQANHAAANAFLDSLAHYRQAQNRPALSIDWGAWAEVGAAAELVGREHHPITAQGYGTIAPEQGVQIMAYLLKQDTPQIGVIPINWAKFQEAHRLSPFLASFSSTTLPALKQPVEQRPAFRRQLEQTPPAKRHTVLVQYLSVTMTQVLGLPSTAQIGLRQGLRELGIDSLMAIELRNLLANNLDHQFPSTLLFDYPTIDALADHILRAIFPESQAVVPAADETEATPEIMSSAVAGLDEDQLGSWIDDAFDRLSK
ncbi:MAG: SDR family NAD(P)-dependent oxidoreductase, partial [Anaerolineae bacterium]|nr:SDR family NAD(P)-dependent oxidoreductase [Anaerolineae bacterium]